MKTPIVEEIMKVTLSLPVIHTLHVKREGFRIEGVTTAEDHSLSLLPYNTHR